VSSFADDLLQQAYHLARKERLNPKQASLRRAVSTAYYALFHLLIDDAVGKWAVARHRAVLARTFEHGSMNKVCEEGMRGFYKAGQPPGGVRLNNVAEAFVELQRRRHLADYDNSLVWSRADAIGAIDTAAAAFKDWHAIRATDAAHDFLLQLFLPKIR
jgi:hypothetical protein